MNFNTTTNQDVEDSLESIMRFDQATNEARKELMYVTKTLIKAAKIMLDAGTWMPASQGGPKELTAHQRKQAKDIIDEWSGL